MTAIIASYRAFVQENQVLLLTLVMLLLFAAAVFFILASLRLRDLRILYQSARARHDLGALDEMLLHQAEVEADLDKRVAALESAAAAEKQAGMLHLQHCALQRYRAFKDVGGDQSFSLVLLDGHGDGVILTSIYGREESRIFAKQVVAGAPTHPLSEEERRVLMAAKEDFAVKRQDISQRTAKW